MLATVARTGPVSVASVAFRVVAEIPAPAAVTDPPELTVSVLKVALWGPLISVVVSEVPEMIIEAPGKPSFGAPKRSVTVFGSGETVTLDKSARRPRFALHILPKVRNY